MSQAEKDPTAPSRIAETVRLPGTIFTFYSFKGGVGRSMCLANVAALLAAAGRKVLIVDWDLEAPGIDRYFRNPPSRVDEPETPIPGLVELMHSIANGEPLDWHTCLRQAYPFGTYRALSILSAGRPDAGYPARVQTLNWEKLFRENRLGESLEQLREEWINEYDFVFIDARTGFTDSGNICTIHLPDVLVLLFTTSEQSLSGVADVARRARIVRSQLPYDRKKLMVIPVPARDETQSQHMEALEWRGRFARELREFYNDWVPQKQTAEDILEKLRIPYKPFWSFGERLPVSERGVEDHLDVGYAYNVLAKFILSGLDWESVFQTQHSESNEQERLGQLIKAGDALLDSLSAQEKTVARSVLLRMVFVAGREEGISDARRWVPDTELAARERSLLIRLFDAGIIERDPERDPAEPRWQLADSGLVSEWPRLEEWIRANRYQLIFRQDLRKRGARLLTASELNLVAAMEEGGLLFGSEEMPVIRLSRQRQKTQRVIGIVAAAAALTFAAFGSYKVYLGRVAAARQRLAAAYAQAARAMSKDESMAAYAALLRFEAVEVEGKSIAQNVSEWDQLASDMRALGERETAPDSILWGTDLGPHFRIEPVTGRMPGFRVIDNKTNALAFQIPNGAPIDTAIMSIDEKYLRVTGGGTTTTWRGPLFNQVTSATSASAVWGLDFSADGKRIAVGTVNVRIWSATDGHEVMRLPTGGMIRALAFSHHGDKLAAVGWDNAITVWDANSGKQLAQVPDLRPQSALAWSPDDQKLAAGGVDGTVRLYSTSNLMKIGLQEERALNLGNGVNTLAFPDGNILGAAGLNGDLRLWEVSSGKAIFDIDLHMGVTRILSDSKLVAIAGWSGLYLRAAPLENAVGFLNDLHTAAVLDVSSFRLHDGSPLTLDGIPLSDSTWIAGATNEGFPFLVRAENESRYSWYPAPYPPSGARSIAFSRDGKLLATGGNDREVRIWRREDRLYTDPCIAVPRNLTPDEWKVYVPDQPYAKLCPNLP